MSAVKDLAEIPVELRERPQWVVWRLEKRDGKPTKVPYVARPPQNRGADGTRNRWQARTTDPSTWRTYLEAVEVSKAAVWDGIGFVFSKDDPFVGVDLDACIDATGRLHPDAGAIISSLNSYTEKSPSGTGVHIIARADLNGSRNRTTSTGWGGDFECYGHSRYFCFTGDHLQGTPTTIENRQHELDEVLGRIFAKPTEPNRPKPTAPVDNLDDAELFERVRHAKNGVTFDRLYGGDTTGYGSQSEADLALIGLLAFWTGPDPSRLDSLFRRSGLYREKWDSPRGESTYGQQTIERALEGRTDFYNQGAPRPEPAAVNAAVPAEPSGDGDHVLRLVPLAEFAAEKEPSAEPLIGTDDDAILSAGGTALLYGDGGTSKTTLTIDGSVHWAAGTPWLGLATPRPLRVLILENEGPRGPFRQKLDRKVKSWDGPGFAHNIFVLEEPWARFTFADEIHRQELAQAVLDHNIDILIANPLQELGTQGGGTPEDVSNFYLYISDFRSRVGRPLAVWFIHHENKAGDVSGAWERVPDTLIHARLEGHGRTVLHWRKTRWSSTLHNTTMRLRWLTDSEGFEVEDAEAAAVAKEARVADATTWIVNYVNQHPGLARSKVENAYHQAHNGGRNDARRAIDRQLELLATWLENPTSCGEQQPLLATTDGEARNGTYLIPFSHACSPLATTLNGEPGEPF